MRIVLFRWYTYTKNVQMYICSPVSWKDWGLPVFFWRKGKIMTKILKCWYQWRLFLMYVCLKCPESVKWRDIFRSVKTKPTAETVQYSMWIFKGNIPQIFKFLLCVDHLCRFFLLHNTLLFSFNPSPNLFKLVVKTKLRVFVKFYKPALPVVVKYDRSDVTFIWFYSILLAWRHHSDN